MECELGRRSKSAGPEQLASTRMVNSDPHSDTVMILESDVTSLGRVWISVHVYLVELFIVAVCTNFFFR